MPNARHHTEDFKEYIEFLSPLSPSLGDVDFENSAGWVKIDSDLARFPPQAQPAYPLMKLFDDMVSYLA